MLELPDSICDFWTLAHCQRPLMIQVSITYLFSVWIQYLYMQISFFCRAINRSTTISRVISKCQHRKPMTQVHQSFSRDVTHLILRMTTSMLTVAGRLLIVYSRHKYAALKMSNNVCHGEKQKGAKTSLSSLTKAFIPPNVIGWRATRGSLA